jgi:hypothetical protein
MNLYTVKQFAEKHRFLTYGGLRWKIHHSSTNGLAVSGALVRDGRKLFIDEDKFFEWYKSITTLHNQ